MEGYVEMQTIRVRDKAPVRQIMLARPERRNAMTPRMQEELLEAMHDAAGVPGCRVVVFSGAGESFCAGLDLDELAMAATKPAAEHTTDARRLALLFQTLYELPLPTIALVRGAAVAGGAGLATLCDYTLASPEARFGYTEVRIGFVPALVSMYLTLQVGDKQARGLLLSGRLVTAEEALRLGLVNEIVPVEQIEGRGAELASQLARNSPEAMRATKRLLAEQHGAWLARATELAVEANAAARMTVDFREGVAAFLEKRRPVWGA